MLDLIYLNIATEMIVDGSPLSQVPSLFTKYKEMLDEKGIPYPKDVEIKLLIDFIIKVYGLLGGLSKIYQIIENLKKEEDRELKGHLSFLKIAVNIIYEKIEEYYLSVLSRKLINTLTRMANETFDETEFFIEIAKSENLDFAFYMPSIPEIEKNSQITLDEFCFEDNKKKNVSCPSPIEIYASIIDANGKLLTQNIYIMKKSFKKEFYLYLSSLIDILAVSTNQTHHIIKDCIMKIGKIACEIRVYEKNGKLEPINQTRLILK